MKIYKGNYRDHWISPITIVEYMFFWTQWSKCGRSKGIIGDVQWVDMPEWADKISDKIQPICTAIKFVLDIIHPPINYIKIDRYDTWSMDHTLADIILPMLKQLKETKHGAPYTEDDDVPEYLRSYMAQPKENEWDTDSLHFMRWDWILNEMIWAFEQKVDDNAEYQFYDDSSVDKSVPLIKRLGQGTWDKEAHDVWYKRKANGFRLFGKYYENLWD